MPEPSPVVTLDVRDDLRMGREPFARIMAAVGELAAGCSLRLLATFEPIPLYRVMANKGFAHVARQIGPEDWEILFGADLMDQEEAPALAPPAGAESGQTIETEWPEPQRHLDNRGLLPPEPMMQILQALEAMEPGQVLLAINERDPVFLYPELEARGHAIRVERQPDGVYVRIRRGGDGR